MNGTIFIAFASHCDYSPFHGWLFAYDEATFTQKSVYVTTPNGGLGGFWMAGVAADSTGNIYIASGNGDFDTINVPARETGDTLLKLGTNNQVLTLLDYFTPQDQATLDTNDMDLGSGGTLLLPDQPGSFPAHRSCRAEDRRAASGRCPAGLRRDHRSGHRPCLRACRARRHGVAGARLRQLRPVPKLRAAWPVLQTDCQPTASERLIWRKDSKPIGSSSRPCWRWCFPAC